MAVNLSNIKHGDVFKTQNGEYMGYWFSEGFSKYKHKLYNLKNEHETYWYSNEGECGDETTQGNFNLVEKIENLSEEEKAAIEKAKKEAVASQKTADFQDAQSDDDLEVSIGWEIVLKVFGWITLVGCIIAFFVLLEDYYLDDMAWMPLVLGIVQIAPIMVFANISISLKKANALKQKILNEMKQMNKTQKETK